MSKFVRKILEEYDENSLQDFINGIELPYKGEFKDEGYVVVVNSSNEFSDIYNFLSKLDSFHVLDNPIADNNNASFTFTDGVFEAKLTGDFKNDFYRLVVSEA